MELVFDFRAIGEGESHAAEDLDCFVADLGKWMEGTGRESASGEGEVDAGEGGTVGDFLDACLFFLKCGGDCGAGGIEGLAESGFLLVRDVLDESTGEGERAFFSDYENAGVIEAACIGCVGDEFEGLSLDGGDLLVHGRRLDSGEDGAGQGFDAGGNEED